MLNYPLSVITASHIIHLARSVTYLSSKMEEPEVCNPHYKTQAIP